MACSCWLPIATGYGRFASGSRLRPLWSRAMAHNSLSSSRTALIGSKATVEKIRAGVEPAQIAASWRADEELGGCCAQILAVLTRSHASLRCACRADRFAVRAFVRRLPDLGERRDQRITVSEGASMSVAVSPDGRTLAVDLQGSIWTIPAAGGTATRITDVFNDARQPAWSPDGKWIAFFGYRDGGYDLWARCARRNRSAQADLGRASTIASRPGPTTARGSRFHPIAAARWAATTASGSSTSRPDRAAAVDESAGRRLHADLVARTTRKSASRRRAEAAHRCGPSALPTAPSGRC